MADKRPTAETLRGQSESELRGQMEELRRQLWQQRIKAREGALPQTHPMRFQRRQIARIQTILNEQRTTSNAGKGS